MVLRIITATLRARLLPIVGEENVDAAVAAVLALNIHPPLKTLRTRNEVEALPNGTPVLIGEPNDPTRRPAFGYKQEHSVVLQGDPHPYPLHDPNVAPPLPCTVLWTPPGDTTDFGIYADGTETEAVYAALLPDQEP